MLDIAEKKHTENKQKLKSHRTQNITYKEDYLYRLFLSEFNVDMILF